DSFGKTSFTPRCNDEPTSFWSANCFPCQKKRAPPSGSTLYRGVGTVGHLRPLEPHPHELAIRPRLVERPIPAPRYPEGLLKRLALDPADGSREPLIDGRVF